MQKIKENIYFVGAIDWKRKLFDELIPLPDGTSYNSYLIKGSEKIALLDSVDPPMFGVLIDELKKANIEKIDYIISHHAEQDHSGSLNELIKKYPEAKIVTNRKCKSMLMDLLLIPEEKFLVIDNGEKLSLGDKTLKFIFTPWVHWPETMSTYLVEDKILFSCDFFGSHYATDELFMKDKDRIYNAAKRYYAEIMMPFRSQVVKNIERISGLEIDIIAPSHGPIYNDVDFIINAYKEWSSDKVKNEVVIPYVSMHGTTEKMVEYLTKALAGKNISVKIFHLTDSDIGELAMALVDAATVVVATSTVLAGPHPNIIYAAYLVKALRPKLRFISVIGSYGWGGRAVEMLSDILSPLKAEVIKSVIIKGYPEEDDFRLLDELAEQISNKHREISRL
ncbi:MAG: FprA family A-type flavoprotein [Actinomycetota bacterium]|nr:FprA family A-type flavoprotein [Actinomycetota bacterium]